MRFENGADPRDVPREDWYAKVTGQAVYVDDLPDLAHTVYGASIRSTQSHARIKRIDSEEALAVPGVLGIFDRDHLDGLDAGIRIGEYAGHTREHGETADQHLLVTDKARFDGDLLGMVVAEDLETAKRAAGLVEVNYEPLPTVFTVDKALAAGAPLLHEDLGSNLACEDSFEWGDVQEGLEVADHVVEGVFYTPSAFHHPMEPVGSCLVDYRADGITLWLPTNKPFNPLGQVAELFGVDAGIVRVRVPVIGGAFGSKQQTPAMMVALALSRRLERPVRLMATEEESFRATARHGCEYKARMGVRADGTLTALDVDLRVDTGAYFTGARLVTRNICISAWGCYRLPNFRVRAQTAYTNKVPAASFRATGKTESTFGIECMIDKGARQLGMSPVEMRQRNVLMPGERIAESWKVRGVEYPADVPPMDTDYPDLMRAVMSSIGWDGSREAEPARAGLARGRGLALSLRHGAQGGGRTYAMVSLDGHGILHVSHAAPDLGEGVYTMLQLVAADALGIAPDRVRVEEPDTKHGLNFEGTAAQRTTVHMGNAVVAACTSLKEELQRAAAQAKGGKPEEWVVQAGRIARDQEVYELGEIVSAFGQAPSFEGDLVLKGLGSYSYAPSRDKAFGGLDHWSPGAVAVEVTIDRETGQLQIVKMAAAADAGRVLHRLSAEGQLQGGAVMGAGLALSEELLYADDMLLNADPFQYRLAEMVDIPPEIPVYFLERADGPGPGGAKGIAQVSSPCVTPAVNNAILDALGVQLSSAPFTAEKLLRETGVLREAPDA